MRADESAITRLFEATRAVECAPSPECAQLRTSVASRLSAAGVAAGTVAVATKAAAVGGTSLGTMALLGTVKAKVVLGVALVAVAVSGTVLVKPLRQEPPVQSQATLLPASEATTMDALFAETPSKAAQLPRETVVAQTMPQAPVIASAILQTKRAKLSSKQDTLAQELELVRGAQSELAAGKPKRVLAILDRYFQRFPKGLLQPEARAARTRALCLAGRVNEAEREAARFAKTNPDSPLITSQKACK